MRRRCAAAAGLRSPTSSAAVGAGAATTTESATSAGRSATVTAIRPSVVAPSPVTAVEVWMPAPRSRSRSASVSTRVAVPPASARNTGPDGGAAASRCRNARVRLAPSAAAAASCGVTARSESSSTSPALMPPTSGPTRCSTTSRPKRPPMNAPMATSSGGAGSVESTSPATARTASSDTMPVRASSSASRGTPRTWRVGYGRTAPRAHTAARPIAGSMSWSSSPSSTHSSTASGTRARKLSAPSSTVRGPPGRSMAEVRTLPPRRSDASRTVTVTSARALASHAAANPVTPPPTTTRWRPAPSALPSVERSPAGPGVTSRPRRSGRRRPPGGPERP